MGISPGRFNHVGQVDGEGPDKEQPLVLQVGGWAWGQSLHPGKRADYGNYNSNDINYAGMSDDDVRSTN